MDRSLLLGNRHPLSQLFIFLGIALLSVSIFSFIPFLLAQPLFGIDALHDQDLFSNHTTPASIALLKFIQLMQSIGLFVVPPLLFTYLYTKQIKGYLQINLPIFPLQLVFITIMLVAAMPAINWMGEMNAQLNLPSSLHGLEVWMKKMETEAEALTKVFLQMPNIGILLFNLVLVAIIPAIGEELVFRGVLQKIIAEWTKNKHLGIWISAILFSAMHLQFYGFVPRMLLGALLGYSLVWTGSIWIPILGHFVNNATAVLLTYLEQRGKISTTVESIGTTSETQLIVLFSFAIVFLFSFLLWRSSKVEKQS
ncbi:MAG TPA: CPBP family intramembrane metalloprotease [Bacteroidia bacterium]|nr:CPBP family intramembrane metalloprotease [Bacteroidia bacterium]HRH08304.1 CPBP family intramembrane metalloprotease [Bacteroidia bacterium]HRH62909.1 CPBP family intramembrane metalloprotease [Bacteroidia bacterium]